MTTVPIGQTKELDIMSNDIFLFEDDSWGASRSKPANTLFNKSVTLNPRLRTARVSVKWYQLVGNMPTWVSSLTLWPPVCTPRSPRCGSAP